MRRKKLPDSFPEEKNREQKQSGNVVVEKFEKIIRDDIAKAKNLESLKDLLENVDELLKKRGIFGFDPEYTQGSKEIVRYIEDIEDKLEKGEELTNEDFQKITRNYGIHTKVIELFKMKAAVNLLE